MKHDQSIAEKFGLPQQSYVKELGNGKIDCHGNCLFKKVIRDSDIGYFFMGQQEYIGFVVKKKRCHNYGSIDVIRFIGTYKEN